MDVSCLANNFWCVRTHSEYREINASSGTLVPWWWCFQGSVLRDWKGILPSVAIITWSLITSLSDWLFWDFQLLLSTNLTGTWYSVVWWTILCNEDVLGVSWKCKTWKIKMLKRMRWKRNLHLKITGTWVWVRRDQFNSLFCRQMVKQIWVGRSR